MLLEKDYYPIDLRLLTDKEERELADQFNRGNHQAADKLLQHNFKLIYTKVSSYCNVFPTGYESKNDVVHNAVILYLSFLRREHHMPYIFTFLNTLPELLSQQSKSDETPISALIKDLNGLHFVGDEDLDHQTEADYSEIHQRILRNIESHEIIQEVLKELESEDRQLVSFYFGLGTKPKTIVELYRFFDISIYEVEQRLDRIFKTLKKNKNLEKLHALI